MCPTYTETNTGHQDQKMTTHCNAYEHKTTMKTKGDRFEVIQSLETVQYFMKPLVYQGSVPLQDAEADASQGCKFDIDQAKSQPRICSGPTWSNYCTGACLANQVFQERKEKLRGCLSGRIVALKCSECGSRSKSTRIIGGRDVALGRWPWQVSLYLNNKHVCGGSIIAQQWIITAAHCVHNYRSPQLSSWSVLSGIVSHSPVVRQQASSSAVEKIIYHRQYDDRTHDYDIALMKLEKSLNYSDSIRPVCLPQYEQDLPSGSECWVSGWGHTHADNTHMPQSLKEARVPLISTKKCNSSCIYDGDITPRMLCAGYLDGKVDACQGDSGGPLVCQTDYTWRLVGVVSWGMGCAEPNRPGVYTKIESFLDWIHKSIEEN
ncbi:transmembrane protease serine 5 [Eleutherodactylus coqui]|uniref:transmembrane protease serine 5 n=1 Tax=Eleutherodactylus coqui TaxID=57060 RepID=UPI003461E854